MTQPFCLTDAGIALGFEDAITECADTSKQNIGTHSDINCCATHNSFAEPPAGGPLQVSERDSKGFAETLFGEGKIGNGVLDGKKVSSNKKSSFKLEVNAEKLKAGRHRLTITAVDTAGNTSTVRRSFSVCKAVAPKHRAAPRFTG